MSTYDSNYLQNRLLTLQALFVSSLAHCILSVTWLPQVAWHSALLIKLV